MKRAFKILALGVAFAASATLAKADSITGQISVAGPDTFNEAAATITFPASSSANTYLVLGQATGTLAPFINGTPVDWLVTGAPVPLGNQSANGSSLVYNSPPTPGGSLEIFSATVASPPGSATALTTLSFTLTSEAWYTDNTSAFDAITILGTGYFDETGYDQTPATFLFTAQEGANGVNTANLDFSGTGLSLAPTPEPSSLALLGTGLLGAAAFARRRFLSRLSA